MKPSVNQSGIWDSTSQLMLPKPWLIQRPGAKSVVLDVCRVSNVKTCKWSYINYVTHFKGGGGLSQYFITVS